MTPINWQAMTPAQRYALVAEQVSGRTIDRSMNFGRLLMMREGSQSLTEEIPAYTQSMDAAMDVLRTVVELEACDKEILCNNLLWAKTWLNCEPQEILERVCEWTPEKICIAALESIGCEVVQ